MSGWWGGGFGVGILGVELGGGGFGGTMREFRVVRDNDHKRIWEWRDKGAGNREDQVREKRMWKVGTDGEVGSDEGRVQKQLSTPLELWVPYKRRLPCFGLKN